MLFAHLIDILEFILDISPLKKKFFADCLIAETRSYQETVNPKFVR
jgi:hypothetical protein